MRVLERVYFIHATQHCTFDTCRDKILLPSIVRIRVPRISLEIRWKFVQQHATHANAPLYCPVLFPPPLSAVHRAHTHTERVTATFRTSRAIPVFRNRRKRKCTPSFDLRIYDRSNSIRFYPSLLLPWEIFVPMETVIYILHP